MNRTNQSETNMSAKILNENYDLLGTVQLSEEEVEHFTSTGSVPARVALCDSQIDALGIDCDDHIYVRE